MKLSRYEEHIKENGMLGRTLKGTDKARQDPVWELDKYILVINTVRMFACKAEINDEMII